MLLLEKNRIYLIIIERGHAIHYIFGKEDADILNKLRVEHPEYLVRTEGTEEGTDAIVDSSSRYGAFLMKASSYEDLKKYLPLPQEE